MIIRRVLSLALAMSMIAVIFTGMSVSAETLTGSVQTYAWDGVTATSQSVFWQGSDLYFNLEFKVDGNLRYSPFVVALADSNWNFIDTRSVTTPNADVYKSWDYGVHFHTAGLSGTYYLAAFLTNSTKLLCTDSFTIRQPGVVYDQEIYNPGQTANFNITTSYNGRINVTIGVENVTWTNQTLTDNTWAGTWSIPSSIKTGTYPLYINRSTDNVPIGFPGGTVLWIDVQVLDFSYSMDKVEYLPGETATVTWIATAVPSNALMSNVSLDWNMTYTDSVDGKVKYQNVTKTDGTFTVVLPANANVNTDITLHATAFVARNQSRMHSGTILIAGLWATVTATPNPVTAGQSIVVTVLAKTTSSNKVIEGANVSVTIYDNDGVTTNLSLTGLITDANGLISGSIKIPSTIKAGAYYVTATVKKLEYTWMISAVLTINDNNNVDVKVDKNVYLSGGVISVEVKTVLNGEISTPDFIEYRLWLADAGMYTVWQVATSSNFTISVPANLAENHAQVIVNVNVDDKTIPGASAVFAIKPLLIILGASEMTYSAGDTITFSAQVIGASAGYDISYTIWDEDGVAIATDVALTIGSNNMTTFKLVVPSDTPSAWYTVSVVADNNAGRIVEANIVVNLIGEYLLNINIVSGPAYSTGEFVPGQVLKVGFEITKQSVDSPDFLVVTASVGLFRGTNTSGPMIYAGEVKLFQSMSGELNITLPKELSTGTYSIGVMTSCDNGFVNLQDFEQISVADNGNGWNSNLGGLSVGDMLMTIMMIVVIIMLLWQMIKGRGAAAGAAGADKKPAEEPKAKEESYAPKASVACANCGSPIEVGTSKRPIEVMCPKCGKSQMVN